MIAQTPIFKWYIDKIPFTYKMLTSPNNSVGIPNYLPITIGGDPNSGRLMQIPDKNITKILRKAYLEGSEISGMMEEDGIGKEYADDFLTHIFSKIVSSMFHGKKVLEIGCGTGYLLSRFKELGADVVGIEPGNHGRKGGSKYGIDIINDFFPSKQITTKFDYILMFCVLEHIEDPVDFLRLVRQFLKEDGCVFLMVPDGESYIDGGEVSLLFHEHYSYFTYRSLYNSLRLAGGDGIIITKSTYSRLLFACFNQGNKDEGTIDYSTIMDSFQQMEVFKSKALHFAKSLAIRINEYQKMIKSIGIYVPGRAINVMTMSDAEYRGVRFFDDNPVLYGKYYPGFFSPVESRSDLMKEPPEIILIMSLSFGEKIAQKIIPELYGRSSVITMKELIQD
jgi:SAM-dependent methyltransferase